ncbi:RusA family crossover junction endodeoxyribonuclease [Massilia sp. Leaf139]|uniref:RusA family crossover junction endodeoxyribonuclease n=1 Tax=Massilia sp. Leaf139 TaxID=1736272 RepID=UPI0006F4620B|nr:RusA family crossover junction endodeoxyribonuclease [Massilia sp. Leaf139]KQQ94980.1 endodeoxyribonuclease RusA [Massilia sp. Leaf139]
MIAFTIPGQPVAKGRPKFARRGAHVVAYTPAKTASYENLVKLAATTAMSGKLPSTKPVALSLVLNLQVPASWSNKRRAAAIAGTICATKKPDADNVLKGIKDGCNGIVWGDDAQVVRMTIEKRYSETPSAIVEVVEVLGEAA